MNEYQVAIGETTFGGRPELADSTGIIDYGSLIYIGLQRSRTAREAIKIMTDLVQQYGYYSEGESFTIADPNERWIMEMIGMGRNAIIGHTYSYPNCSTDAETFTNHFHNPYFVRIGNSKGFSFAIIAVLLH